MRMKKLFLLLPLLTLSVTLGAQTDYTTERDIPYHTDAGAYANERCFLDFYYCFFLHDIFSLFFI